MTMVVLWVALVAWAVWGISRLFPDRPHTFALTGGGARKDTVVVLPNQTVTVDPDADSPGRWMTHCHNSYHAETGMMVNLAYLA